MAEQKKDIFGNKIKKDHIYVTCVENALKVCLVINNTQAFIKGDNRLTNIMAKDLVPITRDQAFLEKEIILTQFNEIKEERKKELARKKELQKTQTIGKIYKGLNDYSVYLGKGTVTFTFRNSEKFPALTKKGYIYLNVLRFFGTKNTFDIDKSFYQNDIIITKKLRLVEEAPLDKSKWYIEDINVFSVPLQKHFTYTFTKPKYEYWSDVVKAEFDLEL